MSVGSRVLVTGGAGYIGSHLCERLLTEGRSVLCLDTSEPRISDLLSLCDGYDGLEILRHDVAAPFSASVGEIYHLARPGIGPDGALIPEVMARDSVLAAGHVLDCARNAGAKLLFASAPSVYGDTDGAVQREDVYGSINPASPRACDGESQRTAETLFFAARRAGTPSLKLARIFSVYGPHMPATSVVGRIILQALNGEPVTLAGDGSQLCSLCYIDDMVDGLMALMGSADGICGPVNLGAPAVCSLRTLAETIIDLTGSASRIISAPVRAGEARAMVPDTSRAAQQLGWQAETPPEEGLRMTIAGFEMELTRNMLQQTALRMLVA